MQNFRESRADWTMKLILLLTEHQPVQNLKKNLLRNECSDAPVPKGSRETTEAPELTVDEEGPRLGLD